MPRFLLASLLTLVALNAPSAETYQEGKHYQLLASPLAVQDPSKIEVVELFWYGCSHCFHFEPLISKWLETKPANVNFRRIPAVFAENWVPHSRAYFAAEALGVLDKFHTPMFRAIHEEGQKIFDEAGIIRFVGQNGIDEADFKSAYTGFAIDGKVKLAMQYTRDSGITGVPSVIVNGKYRTGAQIAGGQDAVLKVVDFLVAKEGAQ
jgi:protein dithiol oxidoreductase (disulfide-forming)